MVCRWNFQSYTVSILSVIYYRLYSTRTCFSAIYSLLKNKRAETYRSLLLILKDLGLNGIPSFIKTDFEAGSINALKNIFPNSRISTCCFHLGQMIQRKLIEHNLLRAYKSEQIIKKFVKALSALSFVDIGMVEVSFFDLKFDERYP